MARTVPIPSSAATAADTCCAAARPFFKNVDEESQNFYLGNSGSDDNDGLTEATPVATIDAALKLAAVHAQDNVNIRLVSIGDSYEEYDMPATMPLCNRITFVGNLKSTASYTLVVSSVIETDEEGGIVLDCTGVGGAGVASDELIGLHVKFPDASNRVGTVKRNDATLPGDLTRLYLSQGPSNANYNTGIDTTQVGDDITLWDRLSGFRISPSTHTVIEASTNLVFQFIRFTGTTTSAVLYVLASDKVDFQHCHFSSMRQVRAGFGGHIFLTNGWGACVGLDTEGGMFVAANGGSITSRFGFVFSGSNAAVNANFCSWFQGGTFRFRNMSHVRTMADPFRVFGGTTEPDSGLGAEDCIYFDDDCTGNAFTFNDDQTWAVGVGGNHYLPHLHGEIAGYAAVAAKGAVVHIGSASTIVTDGATSVVGVNCDGATVERAWSLDGAEIYGGSPHRPPIRVRTFSSFQSVGTYQAVVGEIVSYTAATLTGIDAPAPGDALGLVVGDQWGIKNSSNSNTSITLDGNGNDIENFQSAPGTFSATTGAANPGLAMVFTYDGDDFVAGVT